MGDLSFTNAHKIGIGVTVNRVIKHSDRDVYTFELTHHVDGSHYDNEYYVTFEEGKFRIAYGIHEDCSFSYAVYDIEFLSDEEQFHCVLSGELPKWIEVEFE